MEFLASCPINRINLLPIVALIILSIAIYWIAETLVTKYKNN